MVGRLAGRIAGHGYRADAAPFRGASHSRLTADWILGTTTSADQDIARSGVDLRNRSRELCRNNAWAHRYLDMIADNVVGPGVKLQARLQRGDVPDETMNDRIEDAWRRWGEVGQCTVDRRLSWNDVCREIAVARGRDGEVLIRIVEGFDNAFGFAIQLLDIDQLDETLHVPARAGRNEIRYGIEVDTFGAPVAYHLFDRHPSESLRGQRIRVPVDQVIHYYRPHRIGATRGVPDLAPIMWDLNMLRGYQEAELVAARTAAAKGGFLTRTGDIDGGSTDEDYDPANPLVMDAEPGTWTELPVGITAVPVDPTHPTTAFPEFIKSTLRSVASGLGVSYASLNSDLSDANFSSMREGKNTERDRWIGLQRHLIDHVIMPIYRRWIDAAILRRQIGGTIRPADLLRVEWQPRRWAYVDPDKEAQAGIRQIGAGLTSRTAIAASQGRDIIDIFRDLRREEDLAREFGLDITPETSIWPGIRSVEDKQEDEKRRSGNSDNATLLRLTEGG